MFAEALSETGRKIDATSLFHYQKSSQRKATPWNGCQETQKMLPFPPPLPPRQFTKDERLTRVDLI